MRLLRRLLLALAAIGLLAAVGFGWYVYTGRSRAESLIGHELWRDARGELHRYLKLRPGDDGARLMLAEAYYRDESLPGEEAVEAAMSELESVPDDSEQAALARSQQARIELLLRHRPWRAEKLLEQSLSLDPELVDANYLMWKLYDLTGRSQLAEKWFWKVHNSAERGLPRAQRLREWFMSQFFPATANPALEILMGLPPDPESPLQGEARRFLRFRDAEPDRPIGHAALARAFQADGDLKFAMKLLDEGKPKITENANHPFFLATEINVALGLGDFPKVEKTLAAWPEPREGHEYLYCKALVAHQIRGEYAEAVDAYRALLKEWPGPVEWRIQNRLAECLARLKKGDEAAAVRRRAKEIENLMNDELLGKLRDALGHLDDPERVRELADFYRKIERFREADAWDSHADWVKSERK